MNLGQSVYVVNDSYIIIQSTIHSIKTETYSHFKNYHFEGMTENTTITQYSIRYHSGWYYSDHCFPEWDLAKKFVVDKLARKIKILQCKLRRLRNENTD